MLTTIDARGGPLVRPITWIAVTAEWAPNHAVSGADELLEVRSTGGGAGAMWSVLTEARRHGG